MVTKLEARLMIKVMPKWYPFDRSKGSDQKRPPEHKAVLVCVAPLPRDPGLPYCIAVGYRKNAAGDKQSPYFVVPGHGGHVVAWCDCLPDPDVMNIWRVALEATGISS